MTVKAKFQAIEQELNTTYLEREVPIRGLLVGLISRQHILFLGPPGTGKSAMVEDLCSRIGGQYFRWLLARTSTPEELFGPISLKALEQDSYKRVTTAKLPEADVFFGDEIWKCNSATLNSLLSILNERLFFNNGTPVTVPLQMAVGASNEMPEGEELDALWDRFLLRYVVGSIENMKSTSLSRPEMGAFAEAALCLKYDDVEHAPISPTRLLSTRRWEDEENNNVWGVLNCVQENMIKGGLRGRSASGRKITTRPVKAIDTDVKLNKALWVLADSMAKIKQGF